MNELDNNDAHDVPGARDVDGARDVRALLTSAAAHVQPHERHPVQAVLQRRRQARLKRAGILACVGAALAVGVGTVVGTGVLSSPEQVRVVPAAPPTTAPGPDSQGVTASEATVADAFTAAVRTALPAWQAVDETNPQVEKVSTETGSPGWTVTAAGAGTAPVTNLTLSLTSWSQEQTDAWLQAPCRGIPVATCQETTLADGTVIARENRQDFIVGPADPAAPGANGSVATHELHADALLPNGRVISASAVLVGTVERPLRPADTFSAGSSVTLEGLQALVTSPQLTSLELSE